MIPIPLEEPTKKECSCNKAEIKQDYLIAIQSELKAPKNQFNKWGKYNYRNAEDILEAVKPLLKKYGCYLTITERTEEIAGYLVIISRATIFNGDKSIFVEAQAGINPNQKGMDVAQSFGSSGSYAKKYALGNLFLLDDTKDADSIKVNEPLETPKPKIEKLTDAKFSAMIVAIGEGKASVVQEKMKNYKITKKQKQKLNELILEADLKIKGNETNGVSGIIDDLNSIEIPEEIKNSNNQK